MPKDLQLLILGQFRGLPQELQREEDLVELLTQEFQRCQADIGCVDDLRMYSDFFARKREEIKQQKEQMDLPG